MPLNALLAWLGTHGARHLNGGLRGHAAQTPPLRYLAVHQLFIFLLLLLFTVYFLDPLKLATLRDVGMEIGTIWVRSESWPFELGLAGSLPATPGITVADIRPLCRQTGLSSACGWIALAFSLSHSILHTLSW